jgi:hypothetical protein
MSDNLRADVIYLTRCVDMLRENVDFLIRRLDQIERMKCNEETTMDKSASALDALQSALLAKRQTVEKARIVENLLVDFAGWLDQCVDRNKDGGLPEEQGREYAYRSSSIAFDTLVTNIKQVLK